MRIEERSVELFDNTAQAVSKRRAAGEDTRLDANVALVEAEPGFQFLRYSCNR